MKDCSLEKLAMNLLKRAYGDVNFVDKDYFDGIVNALGKIAVNADETIQFLGECNQWYKDLFDLLNKIGKSDDPEVFYTGGGIWLAAVWCKDKRHYYGISIEDCYDDGEGCLTLYDSDGEDNRDFCFQNVIESKSIGDLDDSERKIYCGLREALDSELFKNGGSLSNYMR